MITKSEHLSCILPAPARPGRRPLNSQVLRRKGKLTLIPNGTPGIFEALGHFYPDTYNQSREREEFARALFDAAPMAIILVDEETRIVADLNTAAASLIGVARDEIVGRSRDEIVLSAAAGQYSSDRTDIYPENNESILIPAFGRPVPVLNFTSRITLKGRPHLLEYYIDISERKQAEDKLTAANNELKNLNRQLKVALVSARQTVSDSLAANETRNEFWANMGHELRTPLSAIIGLSELILDGQSGALNNSQEKHLGEVVQSAHHLLSLINDMLDLSRIEIGELKLEPSEIQLKYLLLEVLTLVKEKALKHGVKLRIETGNSPASITADERKLKQVLYSLLVDAVKSRPNGGQIRMRAESAEGMLCISVEDTGNATEPGEREHIHEPAGRTCSYDGGRFQQTGVGLSLVRRLVELHGGRIWTENEAEGSEKAIRVTIPLRHDVDFRGDSGTE